MKTKTQSNGSSPLKTAEVAKLVRQLRHQLNLSQVEFAGLLGVAFRTVNRWENGRAIPSPLAIEKLEELFRKTVGSSDGKVLLEKSFLSQE